MSVNAFIGRVVAQRYKVVLVFLFIGLLAQTAPADIIFHWTFDGPFAEDIVSDTDIASAVPVWAFDDFQLSPDDECSLKYGQPAIFYGIGTSAEFDNINAAGPAENDPGIGLFAPDRGVDTLMDLAGLPQFTIESCIYPCTLRQSVIIRKYGGLGRYYIDLRSTGALSFVINSDSNVVAAPEGTVTPHEWYHISATFDQNDTPAPMKLYVNGLLAASGGSTVPPFDSTRALSIGCIVRDNNTPPLNSGQFFDGRIDEVRIFDEALSYDFGVSVPTIGFATSRSGDLEQVSPAQVQVTLRHRYVNHTYLVDYVVTGGTADGNGLDYALMGCCACDYDGSGSVDYPDLRILAQNWLSATSNNPADVTGDDTVNFRDFARLASQWRSIRDLYTLRFPPGVNRQTIDVDIISDGLPETDETIVLTLSNPLGLYATIGYHQTAHTYTIIDSAGPASVRTPPPSLTSHHQKISR